jgi:hypothetical protein
VGKRPLGSPGCRWVDMLRWSLERGWCGVDWIGLAQDKGKWRALVNVVMNLWESMKCWDTTEWLHNRWSLE